jgi:hypothetical protein
MFSGETYSCTADWYTYSIRKPNHPHHRYHCLTLMLQLLGSSPFDRAQDFEDLDGCFVIIVKWTEADETQKEVLSFRKHLFNF